MVINKKLKQFGNILKNRNGHVIANRIIVPFLFKQEKFFLLTQGEKTLVT
jgi:hypothetical protein